MTLFYFVNPHVNRLVDNTIIAYFYWNAFQFMVNCLLLRSNFRECYSPTFDVSFQIALCLHAENCLMILSLQTNLCFIMHDAFEIIRERHFIFAFTLLSS